ncbi:MAG: hypothetical protein EBR10_01825 [Planctomycetes bacterium]|nr:hypothetical protein [Planctomycetota bacterium]
MKDRKTHFNINRFNSLIKKWTPKARTEEPNSGDLVALFLHSSLLYDATLEQADAALARIRSRNVDFNEFRVNLVEEMVQTINPKFPEAFSRMRRVRSTLADVFRRHHKVSLDQLVGKPKRDVRTYLEHLDGMPTYVSSRMMLVGFEVALVPIDQTTVDLMRHTEVLVDDATPAEFAAALERRFSLERALQVHHALTAAVDHFHTSGRAEEARKERESKPKPRGAVRQAMERAKKVRRGGRSSAVRS